MADVETFLAPLSEGNPSGAELRNDLRFHAIERRVQPATRQSRKEAESSGGPGARMALITTAGFEDVLEIGRQARPDLYNFAVERPARRNLREFHR